MGYVHYCRNNVLLPKPMLEQLHAIAPEQLLSISALIRKVIQQRMHVDADTIILDNKFDGANEQLSVRLTRAESVFLDDMAHKNGLSKSSLVRFYITQYLQAYNTGRDLFSSAHYHADFYGMVDAYMSKKMPGTTGNLILVAYAYERIGMLAKATALVEFLKINTPLTVPQRFELVLIELQVAILNWQVKDAYRLASQAARIAASVSDRRLVGRMYFLRAELARIEDTVEDALINYQTALHYFDMVSCPADVIEVDIRMASLLLYLTDFGCANTMLRQVKHDLETNAIHYFWGQYHNAMGIFDQLTGKYDESTGEFMKGIEYCSANRSLREMTYGYENLARTALLKKNYASSFSYLKKLERLESLFRPKTAFNRCSVFGYYTKFAMNHSVSLNELDNYAHLRTPRCKPNFTKYVVNSAKYLFGNEKMKSQGKYGLKELAATGKHALVRHAARDCIQQKCLQAMI